MQIQSQKKQGEVIDIISSEELASIVELVNEGDSINKNTISPSYTKLNDNFYKFSYTCPTVDCIVCLLGVTPLFLRVGNPGVRYCVYSSNPVDWIRTRISDGEQETGTTTDLGEGFQVSTFGDLDYSLLEVIGLHTTTVSVPYNKPFNDISNDYGTIRLQRGVWQLIAMPVVSKNVAEYLCDRLAEQEGVEASDLIEVTNTYRGTEDKFFSYVPGVTAKTSVNNFPLVYDDNGSNEIAGVWVKMKEYAHTTDDLVLTWNLAD